MLVWRTGIGLLARAGVTRLQRRVVFLALVMPAGLISSILLPIWTLAGLAVLFDPTARHEPFLGSTFLRVWFIAEASLLCGVFGGHWLARWVAGTPQPPTVELPEGRPDDLYPGTDHPDASRSSNNRDTAQAG